jgi:hypothetical protein
MKNPTEILCPNCQTKIDVNDILTHQLEEQFKKKLSEDKEMLRAEFEKKEAELAQKRQSFEEAKKKENELFQQKMEAALRMEKEQLEKKLRQKLNEENEDSYKALQAELNAKSEQIKELNRSKAEIEKLKREKAEMKEVIEAESQKMLNQKLSEEKEKIRKTEHDKTELVIRELQKQLEDQKKLTEEMKRKQEQGSMQLQGEVQELVIEEVLRAAFPFDVIEEVSKGIRGADCVQLVRNNLMQDCGRIIYESKRTKSFSHDWIVKLKEDMRSAGAEIAVLITEALPKDQTCFAPVNGVWVCSFTEFRALACVLREGLIRVQMASAANENKGDKMQMLYAYLTGNEFRQQVEAIVEGFKCLQEELDREKRLMEKTWKIREKQIEKVMKNTLHLYGSVKGIAGASVQEIKLLDTDPKLPEPGSAE